MASSSERRGRSDLKKAAARRQTVLIASSAIVLLIFGSCGVVWAVALSLLARRGMLPSYDTKEKLYEDFVKHQEAISLAVEARAPRARLDDLRARTFVLNTRYVTLGVTEEDQIAANSIAYRERMVAVNVRNMLTMLSRPAAEDDILWALGGTRIHDPW